MPLPNNEFLIPDSEATPFSHGDRLNFHIATSELSDLGDARDLIHTAQALSETVPAPEFGTKEAMNIGEWLERMRTDFGNENWNLED